MEEHQQDVIRFLEHIYDPEEREYECRAQIPKEFRSWKTVAVKAYVELLGLPRIEAAAEGHTPVVEIADEETPMDGFTRKRGYIETEPGVSIHFWLLVPDGDGPFPVAITPHGHENGDRYAGIWENEQDRELIESEDRDVAVQAARRGFLAIAPATRSIGNNPRSFVVRDIASRHSNRDCVCHNWQVLAAGRTALGERVWDLEKIVDWVTTRPDTDPHRILLMGNSGGGMATLHTAACDERIGVAVPCCAFNNYISFAGTLRHCPCNAIPGILNFGEFWDVAGLVAPRPMLTVNGVADALHPVEEVDMAVARLKRIYTAAGAPDRYEHRYGPAGHRFYSDIMWPWIESQFPGQGA